MKELFESLSLRARPEDLIKHIEAAVSNNAISRELAILKAARPTWYGRLTSMPGRFHKHPGLGPIVGIAQRVFEDDWLVDGSLEDLMGVKSFIQRSNKSLNRVPDANYTQRLNREQRKNEGMVISKRQYNKRYRMLRRLEKKLGVSLIEMEKDRMAMMAKSGLVSEISWDEFSKDANSACFVAYLTARYNVRNIFSASGQTRAFDRVARMLYKRCEQSKTTNWFLVAHIHPEQKVLERLIDAQKGELLGKWFNVLESMARMLGQVYSQSKFDKSTMIVSRGNDSSTWNAAAGAWNKARINYISLLYSMGLQKMLESVCPGKVMRLMAADVAAWHSKLDPATFVWAELPPPWEVFEGKVPCTKLDVEAACRKHGVKPSSWTGPQKTVRVEETKPTPELVHGVAVSCPFLADRLRKAGWFSGKGSKSVEGVKVERDERGFVTGASHNDVAFRGPGGAYTSRFDT